MNLYTIGFTQKSAEKFFSLISQNNIDLVLDVRLWNSTQLAGFSKGGDLRYFLKTICNCDYAHATEFAPSKELLDGYKKGSISWEEYVPIYRRIIEKRNTVIGFEMRYSGENICLLCAEPTAEKCHRRLAAEMIADYFSDVKIKHI
jgi:uncharacterized protein (DUF488 family)